MNPMAHGVRSMLGLLPLLTFLNGGLTVGVGTAENREEHLYKGVVRVIVACPFAVDDARESGWIGGIS